MTASSRGSRAVTYLLRSTRHPRVCTDCIKHITTTSSLLQRNYSAAAAAALKTSDVVSHDPRVQNLPPVTATASVTSYKIKSGVLLSRPPLLTKPLNPFEKAFFFYQKRLNERLVMPFTRYFYFKKDTPADHDWKLKAKERNGQAARELGGYNPYGELGWNDELLVGDEKSETSYLMDSLVRDAQVRAVEGKDGKPIETEGGDGEGGVVERPLSPWTEADMAKDTKRLDRKLARTLYLVVKRENGGWGLPAGELVGRENLNQAAERVLVQTAGLNMNTWIVGHVPVGHHVLEPYVYPETSAVRPGEKTFFMKARIMAGQANITDNLFGISDFKWLTKQELQRHVGPRYFSHIKNMLADR